MLSSGAETVLFCLLLFQIRDQCIMPQSHQTNRHATDKKKRISLICRISLVNFFPTVSIHPHERYIEHMKRTLTVQVIEIYRTLNRLLTEITV